MQTRYLPLVLSLGITLLGCAGQTVNREAEKAALLKASDQEIAAVLAADTAALRASIPEGDTTYNVTNGQILRATHANALEGYDFGTVRYTAATVLDSPIVHVSSDGRMAWIAARYRFTYMRKDPAGVEHQGQLVDATLAVYQKKGSRWVGAALAQTFPPTN